MRTTRGFAAVLYVLLPMCRHGSQGTMAGMNIVILDDYQDAVRKLHCAARLDAYSAKVYTNTVKGLGSCRYA